MLEARSCQLSQVNTDAGMTLSHTESFIDPTIGAAFLLLCTLKAPSSQLQRIYWILK